MIDISDELFTVQEQEHCSELLAFIMLKYGLYLQKSKSTEQSCRGLCDSWDINTDK